MWYIGNSPIVAEKYYTTEYKARAYPAQSIPRPPSRWIHLRADHALHHPYDSVLNQLSTVDCGYANHCHAMQISNQIVIDKFPGHNNRSKKHSRILNPDRCKNRTSSTNCRPHFRSPRVLPSRPGTFASPSRQSANLAPDCPLQAHWGWLPCSTLCFVNLLCGVSNWVGRSPHLDNPSSQWSGCHYWSES